MDSLNYKKLEHLLNILHMISLILLIYFGYFTDQRPKILLVLFLILVSIRLIYGIYKLIAFRQQVKELNFLWDFIIFPASILVLFIILKL